MLIYLKGCLARVQISKPQGGPQMKQNHTFLNVLVANWCPLLQLHPAFLDVVTKFDFVVWCCLFVMAVLYMCSFPPLCSCLSPVRTEGGEGEKKQADPVSTFSGLLLNLGCSSPLISAPSLSSQLKFGLITTPQT